MGKKGNQEIIQTATAQILEKVTILSSQTGSSQTNTTSEEPDKLPHKTQDSTINSKSGNDAENSSTVTESSMDSISQIPIINTKETQTLPDRRTRSRRVRNPSSESEKSTITTKIDRESNTVSKIPLKEGTSLLNVKSAIILASDGSPPVLHIPESNNDYDTLHYEDSDSDQEINIENE